MASSQSKTGNKSLAVFDRPCAATTLASLMG
jgi:hypothetical protein